METFKIYINNEIKLVSFFEYKKWLADNTSLYFIGPHITEDKREIYTAFSANSSTASCFTTFELFLNDDGMGEVENIYESNDWITAREMHKALLKPQKIREARAA